MFGINTSALAQLRLLGHCVILLNCGLSAALGGFAALAQHKRHQLNADALVSPIYVWSAMSSGFAAILSSICLFKGQAEPVFGDGIWFIDSCLLLASVIGLARNTHRPDLISLIGASGLCFSSSLELIARFLNGSGSILVVAVPCVFWLCGAVLLGLRYYRFPAIGLSGFVSIREEIRWFVPLVFVIPVLTVVPLGVLERRGYLGFPIGETLTAAVFCLALLSVIFFATILLRRSEKGFWKLFADSPEAILIVDCKTHRIRSRNSKAIEFFGLQEERPGRRLEDVFPTVSAATVCELCEQQNGRLTGGAIEISWKDERGRERWLELIRTPVPFGDCRLLMIHVADVSQRKFIQITQSLTEKMQVLSQLARGIAHSFNNLFHGISMCSSLLEGEGADNQELLKQITASVMGAKRMSNLLLDYCDRTKTPEQKTDLNLLVTSVAFLLHCSFGAQFSVRTNLVEGPTEIAIAPNRMEEIIVNLAMNAREAMPTGGSLLLKTSLVEPTPTDQLSSAGTGGYVVLEVADSGIGMNDETISHAFEPFFTTKGLSQGTGLGLSVVESIVRSAGGFVRLASHEGQGTRVEVLLPAYQENFESRTTNDACDVA
jgi:PAS domain S-box-containing protein